MLYVVMHNTSMSIIYCKQRCVGVHIEIHQTRMCILKQMHTCKFTHMPNTQNSGCGIKQIGRYADQQMLCQGQG